MDIKKAFIPIAIILVGLVVGVPVLQSIFATGGPFGQLQGVAQGTCDYAPPAIAVVGTAYRTLPAATQLNNGVLLSTQSAAIGTFGANTAITFVAVIPGTNFVVEGQAATFALTCNSSVDIVAAPYVAGTGVGTSAITGDAQLSSNPYSGILIALILLIPLGIIAFFAFRFFSSRMG